jgi:hypothetical protein
LVEPQEAVAKSPRYDLEFPGASVLRFNSAKIQLGFQPAQFNLQLHGHLQRGLADCQRIPFVACCVHELEKQSPSVFESVLRRFLFWCR